MEPGRQLERVGAAGGRAVVRAYPLLAGAHALHEGDPPGEHPVAGPKRQPGIRAGRAQHPLELGSRDHVHAGFIPELGLPGRVEGGRARRDHDLIECDPRDLGLLVVDDGVAVALRQAQATPDAAPAAQAPFGLAESQLFVEAKIDLREAQVALFERELRHLRAGRRYVVELGYELRLLHVTPRGSR